MKFNMRCFIALFKKDFKNSFTNKNVLLLLCLPVMFCLLYTMIYSDMEGIPTGFVTILCIVLVLSIIPVNILANMVAEEKEKHTLRSLMMANVSASEFLLSKATVALLLVVLDSFLIFICCGEGFLNIGYLLIVITIVSIGLLFFGALVGLLSKDQMSAGTLSSPIMILLMLPPMFANMNAFFEKIAVAFPTTSFKTLYVILQYGQSLFSQDALIAFGVAVAWIVLGLIGFTIVYKKRGLDD